MAIARYTLAVDRRGRARGNQDGDQGQTADFINIVAFDRAGEFAEKYFRQGMRVQEAGERVGFRSNEHFIRTFKRLTGVPPKRYAMRYRESDQKMNPEIVVVEGRDGRQVESLKA